jgi:uncharacterized protein (DUF486 family)
LTTIPCGFWARESLVFGIAGGRSNRDPARPVERLHDFCLVRASEEPERQSLVDRCIGVSIALFEYLLQVPANRIGHRELSLGQLKILQEVITLTVFVPFVLLYMREPLKLDYLWAGLCILGAVYFIFRSP